MKVLFVSANKGGGGSEELWVQTACVLARLGHQVNSATTWSMRAQARLSQLAEGGVPHHRLVTPKWRRLLGRMAPMVQLAGDAEALRRLVQRNRPDLVVMNSGTSLDGIGLMQVLRNAKVPYGIVTHLVSSDNWPDDDTAMHLHACFAAAVETCFVSEHNKRLFEIQTGRDLANAVIVRNPYLVSSAKPLPWPDAGAGNILRLALPARLYPKTKGHDVLIEVLSKDPWRQRALEVTFFGEGPCRGTLEASVRRLGVERVSFAGQVKDIEAVWKSHHALILPSRHEGLPICIVEAMMAGRPVIVNPAGGSGELVTEGVDGFVAESCDARGLAHAMERAWERRHDWADMGLAAARSIRQKVPANPAAVFAERVLRWGTPR